MLYEEALQVNTDEVAQLPVDEHISKVKEIYIAIKPALTSFSWLVGIVAPKLKKTINLLIQILDNLFQII